MKEHVIITVQARDGDFCVDMELPLKIPMSELSKGMLATLKEFAPDQFRGYEELHVWYGKKRLLPHETMESNSIWDGSIIYVGGGA